MFVFLFQEQSIFSMSLCSNLLLVLIVIKLANINLYVLKPKLKHRSAVGRNKCTGFYWTTF